jgi:hypothetical protein
MYVYKRGDVLVREQGKEEVVRVTAVPWVKKPDERHGYLENVSGL